MAGVIDIDNDNTSFGEGTLTDVVTVDNSLELEYVITGAFDISTATVSQSIATQDTYPSGITWNNDGTKVYVIGDGSDSIYESNVSTPFDISTATFSQSITSKDAVPMGMAWNNDGTKMYEVGYSSDLIHEYNLSTAFDISTATFSQSITAQDSIPMGITWNNDGTKMYEIGYSSNLIYESNVSTPFDISTATFNQSIATQDTYPQGMTWNNDGTKMYEVGDASNSIYEYNVSTAFDISTATVSQSITTQDSTPMGMAWNNDGTKMYEVGDASDSIYEYNLGSGSSYATSGNRQSPQLDLSAVNDVASSLIEWQAFDGLSFDGVDDKASLGDFSNNYISDPSISGAMTYEFWGVIRGGYYIISSGAQTGSTGMVFSYQNGTPFLQINNGIQNWRLNPSIPLNTLAHHAITWDGNEMKYYRDGLLISSIGGASDVQTDNYTELMLGVPNNSQNNYWGDFDIDELRFWNVARTQQEIQDNMYKRLDGTEIGLTNYYRMDEGSGTTLTDSAGTNDGTIYGASWLNTTIETSVDSGSTWQTATNGGAIPNLPANPTTLDVRQTLNTNDITVTPVLESLEVRVNDIIVNSHDGNGEGFSQVSPLLYIINSYTGSGLGIGKYYPLNIVVNNYSGSGVGTAVNDPLSIILENKHIGSGVGNSESNSLLIIENDYFGEGVGTAEYNSSTFFLLKAVHKGSGIGTATHEAENIYVWRVSHIGNGEADAEFKGVLVGKLVFRGKYYSSKRGNK